MHDVNKVTIALLLVVFLHLLSLWRPWSRVDVQQAAAAASICTPSL
jgi:hypothetical protein